MAAASLPGGAPDLHKPRRGRPPLLVKSALNSGSLDRFLKPGLSSSASTSASSASAMTGNELASSENQNPNVVPCQRPSSKPQHNSSVIGVCSTKADKGSKQVSRGRPRKVPSPASIATSSGNVPPGTSTCADPNSISAAVDLNPMLDRADPDAVNNHVPEKAGRGRPRKKAGVKPDLLAVDSADVSLSKGVSAEAALNDVPKIPKKGSKRKRTIATGPLDAESRCSLVKEFRSEVTSLIRFYNEDGKIDLTPARIMNSGKRAEIALLVEESGLPFSSLVVNLLQQLKATDDVQGGSGLTLASLRSIVLSIGERISFGTPNPDADVLEDDSEACLWCWEVRDIKLLPEAFRNIIVTRRRKRRKIAERISALSGIIAALTAASDDEDQDTSMLEKAEEALMKTDDEEQIRAYVGHWKQKTAVKVAVQAERAKEKEVLREQHRLARETEKEQRRLDKEEEKEKKRLVKEEEKRKIQQEKEHERLEREKERLEKEAIKQRSKEASRQEKELKRQQEETERDQKRKEKEEADLRRQSALKRQASLMDRFLQQSKKDLAESTCLLEQTGAVHEAPSVNLLHPKVIHEMDCELLHCEEKSSQDLLSSHLMAWKKQSSRQTNRSMRRWGQRRLPKRTPMNELRLQGGQSNVFGGAIGSQPGIGVATVAGCKRSRTEYEDSELSAEKLESEWDDSAIVDFAALLEPDLVTDSQKSSQFLNKRRKLLQFDKSYRPAYYGSFSKKSDAVKPRSPLRMDPNLDYEIDSDEEWEEEDPGESLSDCEKDEEDEKPEVDEDEETGDGFLVPDGYLSESEGAHVEESESESDAEHSQNEISAEILSDSALQPEGNHSLLKFARQRKALEQLTDHALRCNRPYIICNFNQNKDPIVRNSDRLCLEALRVCPMSYGVQIEVPEDPQVQKLDNNGNRKSKQRIKRSLPDTSLREMVEILLSSTSGLKRLVGVLSEKFPTASRSQLKDKVKEIADFTDNHWQVKKEILEQLGISFPCPQAANSEPVAKSPVQLKPITTFFSKRCLPPGIAGLDDTSPMKEKESCCARSDMVAGGDILQNQANSMPLVQSNPVQSI